MMKGEMPSASTERMIPLWGFMYLRSRGSEARGELRKRSTQMALQACDRMVASAAPFTPMPKVKMNSGSSRMFSMAPMSTEYMAMAGRPWVLMKGFSPTDNSTNRVPAR